MKASISENVVTVISSPTTVLTLVGVVVLLIGLIKMKKVQFNARIMAHIGLAIALAAILHAFQLYKMPQGGSVTLGSMLPILLMAVYYGPEVGFLTGFVYGIVNLIQSPYILHPIQVLFDYPLPFMALGLAGYFKDRMVVGTIAGISARFICHYISGIVFFASYAPKGMSPYLYSLVFNASYLVPECIICLILMRVLPVKRIEETIKFAQKKA
ncbi:energy-coupled thiamine transporter ThiT [Sporomusa sp.]|uniref:energy-coupled thiamine transporter ThiT n=1 Tax=Sporomusa sp. TaxID=2078658 RepID=UPI002CD3D9BA|nr:energy-coupled thiamine transporter ThiT [Sporomusa sp.]HWR43780.1 energy-coupled thiamine transporter ThiT [Sporomusa sp.]